MRRTSGLAHVVGAKATHEEAHDAMPTHAKMGLRRLAPGLIVVCKAGGNGATVNEAYSKRLTIPLR